MKRKILQQKPDAINQKSGDDSRHIIRSTNEIYEKYSAINFQYNAIYEEAPSSLLS